MAKTIILAIFLITQTPTPQIPSRQPLQPLGHSRWMKREYVRETFTAIATSYCLRGRTATGTKPKIGTVAVDPRIIPLGSILYIKSYGWARAEDTGSAIKGKRIDIWLPSKEQSLKWGVKRVKVVVYKPSKRK